MVNLGEMPADCWTSPYDFENGHYFLRFEILEQPSSQAFIFVVGFWQNVHTVGGHSETISSRVLMEKGAGTLLVAGLGSAASWWELSPDKPVDFCKPQDLDKIGLALWKAEPLCIPMAQRWNNSYACENPDSAALEFFPMKARITVIAIADGHNFSGWQNYP